MKKVLTSMSVVFLLIALVSCNNSSDKDSYKNITVAETNISVHDADNYKLDNSKSYFEFITEKDDVFKIKFVIGNFKVKEDKLISGIMFLDIKSLDPEAKPINAVFLDKDYMDAKYFPQAILEIIRVKDYTGRKPLFGFKPTHMLTAIFQVKNVSKEIDLPVKLIFNKGACELSSSEIDFKGSKWNIGSERSIMLENAKIKLDISAKKK